LFDEIADDRHAKQGRFGKKRHRSRRKAQKKDRIDERIRVIEYEDDGRIEGNTFDTSDLDALEVNSQRKSHEGNDDPPNHIL
jgi:hypothetical protein